MTQIDAARSGIITPEMEQVAKDEFRDPEFIRAWSDIYSENYESVSLEAIRAFDDTTRKPVPEEA